MYKDNFVVALKCQGQILRDHGQNHDEVYLPFGTEYSIFLRNQHCRRAVVSVSIDGQDVLNGHRLVVEANGCLELERFLSNLSEGNRFKFIQKTDRISQYRGDLIDDGLLRVEWRFEQPAPEPTISVRPGYPRTITYSTLDCLPIFTCSTASLSNELGDDAGLLSNASMHSAVVGTLNTEIVNATTTSNNITTNGITVKGSVSDQHFGVTYTGTLETTPHVIVLRLFGKTATHELTKPVTVTTKLQCTTCGYKAPSRMSYCPKCGTALSLAVN